MTCNFSSTRRLIYEQGTTKQNVVRVLEIEEIVTYPSTNLYEQGTTKQKLLQNVVKDEEIVTYRYHCFNSALAPYDNAGKVLFLCTKNGLKRAYVFHPEK